MVLIAHGSLPSQKDCEQSADYSRKVFEVNALSTISMLTHLANYFESKGQGTIAVISSVAGDRGRQSNYLYGSAKGAVTIFLQGLRNRLYKSDVHVITVKPGFVDTPMTAAFDKGFLWADPDQIAIRIISAIKNESDEVYAPWYWRVIMLLIRVIPERVLNALTFDGYPLADLDRLWNFCIAYRN
jgi:decaprenylphospho-beta-D-erythro-pentofuranosid-2-ulose 2-reductase